MMIFRTVISISGKTSRVDAVETLIREVGKRTGVMDNELGLYIPFQAVMQVIEGENDHEGNIIFMERTANGEIILKCEEGPRSLFALEAALQEYFEVEIDDYEWE
ncbi:MAG: hypothetical protein KBT33_00070 [Prevotellaceae bacterium]|nr:hypothetical protein [Candidatus Minthosoma equi]